MGQAAPAHFAVGAEKLRQIHVRAEPGHAQIHIVAACHHDVLKGGAVGLQCGAGQAQIRQIAGDFSSNSGSGGVVGVHQQPQLFVLAVLLGNPVAGQLVDEFQRVIGVLCRQAFVVEGSRGRTGQGHRVHQSLIGRLGQSFPIQAVGQEGSQRTVIKMLGIENVAADVEHIATLDLPQLIVAAVFGEGVAHGVGAHHADGILPIKLEGITNLGGAAHRHQTDGQVTGRDLQSAAPPVGIPLEHRAAAVLDKHIGAASGGNLARGGHIHIRRLYNGHIQQQGQVLHVRIRLEQNAAVLCSFHIQQMLVEAVLIVVVLHGLLIGRHHVRRSNSGAIGEGSALLQIEGPVPVIGGDFIAGAENGRHVLLAVHGEQALIHQRHQHTVGVVAAENRVQGPVRVVGQHQILGILLFLGFRRLLALHQNGVAGGRITRIVNIPGAARQQRQKKPQRQKQTDDPFHRQTSLQQITAP